jgi:muramidase (phage lysozyme)
MMSANLRAFLYLVAWAEGTSGKDGYRTIVGGETFDDFSDHPRKVKSGTFSTGKAWKSSAAGRYQFLAGTWDECKTALDLPDFSPESQDAAAVFLIKRRGALHAVEEGNLDQALNILNKEWASLPGSPYGQPTKSLDACREIFRLAGGIEMQRAGVPPLVASPPPMPAPAAPTKEPAMPLPISAVIALGAELLKLVPFARKPERQEQVDAVAKVNQAVSGDVLATSHPIPMANVFREDIVKPSLTQAQALSGAADSESGRFKVSAILDEE